MQIARIKHRFMIISVKMFIKKDLRCKSFSKLILQMRERYVSRINIRFRISSYLPSTIVFVLFILFSYFTLFIYHYLGSPFIFTETSSI